MGATIYEFVSGPLVWVAFIVFIGGMVVKTVSLLSLTSKKDKVVFNHLHLGWSIRSILHWLIPFGSDGMRKNPVFTIAGFTFHICLIATPIFLVAHNVLLDESWGVSLWTIPDKIADWMTLLLIAAAIILILRRLILPEVKIVTTALDYLLLAAATAPFITGYMAYNQWLDSEVITIIHILCGELMLIIIPFTKLSHILLFFLSRAHIGSEFGERRGSPTW